MHVDHPQKKHRWRPFKRRNSNHNLSDENGSRPASESEASLHSSSRTTVSSTPSRTLFDRLLRKGAKIPSAQSARQSSNSASLTPESGVQDPFSQTDREPSTSTALALHPDLGQDTNPSTMVAQHQTEAPDPDKRIADARKAAENMKGLSGHVQNAASATDNVQSGLDTIDNLSSIIAPLKAFTSIANEIGKIHPYAQIVTSILTCASKMILDQVQLDNDVRGLLEKVSEVYTFMREDGRLAEIHSMEALFGKLARQTLECADFIVHYSELQSAWKRIGKHAFGDTNSKVQSFIEVLDGLMQQFRDRAAREIVIDVHRMAEDQNIMDMEYVRGAGRDTSKCCLTDTRKEILSKIKDWVDNIGEDVPRVFWLSGTAGKGKSTIAHTIANWFLERGDPGACFCFDHTREAENRHEKIFSTMTRDLADRDPIIRRALASAIHNDNELRHTKDITRQWKKLVLGPVRAASQVAAPILMVIDALDESGGVPSRKQILQMLAEKLDQNSSESMELPANIRILVTSRPLNDINSELDAAPHVCHVSMDDLPAESTENDIKLYISDQLAGQRNAFEDKHFRELAQKADGLFEWARLACAYIMGMNEAGVIPMERFEEVIAGTSEDQGGTCLLDDMYHLILAKIIPKTGKKAIARVSSVMAQVLASLEPLSMSALTAMRQHFPVVPRDNEVELVIKQMGSLFAGISNSHTPIRPLHASFYDFLTDESRSKEFFIDKSSASGGLAFASLRVMKAGLRFNICSLESSYLPNSSIPDLEQRVKESIPPELSYSCRFWGTHVQATSFDSSLAEEVQAFFDEERLLFWLEALSLLKSVGDSLGTLSSIANWLQSQVEYTDLVESVRDTQRFIRTFAPAFVHSTPHLYLSALPFAPTQSRISRMFSEKFPRTPRVAASHVAQWPVIEKILHVNSEANSVAVSPDGRCIVCGLYDGTILVCDTETGEALCALQGHTEVVKCVTISLDGHHIVSCSQDKTIRLWDAHTFRPLGDHLLGCSSRVSSMGLSPDGRRIVSGSVNGSIRVWNADTGEALGAHLEGHSDWVDCVAISPDGTHVASCSCQNAMRVWDMTTEKELFALLLGQMDRVSCVAFSPDGKRIVSGSSDGSIWVRDADSGEALGSPLKGHIDAIVSVAVSPDGTRIASGSCDKTIRIWDIETGTACGAAMLGHLGDVRSIAFSPDGKRIVSGSADQTIRIWDIDTGMAIGASQAVQEHTDTVDSIAMSPDGTHFVFIMGQSAWVWNVNTAKPLRVPTKGEGIKDIAFSPDGKYFITGSWDWKIELWDTKTSVALGVPLQGDAHIVCFIVISKDGKRFMSGSIDNTILVCDADTGNALGSPFKGHTSSVWCAAISPDGNRLVSGAEDGTILVWDIETGRVIGEPLLGHTHGIRSVAISPDGKHVVSGSNDKTILAWDMELGMAMSRPLQGHTDIVTSVAISPDGKHIVSGSHDWTIRVWDMETGRAIGAPFYGHTGAVNSVIISPDGKNIISGSSDGSIRVWTLDSFLGRSPGFEAHAIQFSSNPIHALSSTSICLDDSRIPASFAITEEGWVVGPRGSLLFWVPMNFHQIIYFPGNSLVIANDALQLDLSHFAHGASWEMCRGQVSALSS